MNAFDVDRLVEHLAPNLCRTYVLVDAARDRALLPELRDNRIEAHCLFAGVKAHTLDTVAPYVIAAEALAGRLPEFIAATWGTSWTVWVESTQGLEPVRRQLKKGLMVEVDQATTGGDARNAYFRFYDSRALLRFIRTATVKQVDSLFGATIESLVAMRSLADGTVVRITRHQRRSPGGDTRPLFTLADLELY